MTLTPQQRQLCLEVMGITVYRQRATLPGAARDNTVIWPPVVASRAADSAALATEQSRANVAALQPSLTTPGNVQRARPTAASALLDTLLERPEDLPQIRPAPAHIPDTGAVSVAVPDTDRVVEPVEPVEPPATTPTKHEATLRYRVVLLPVNERLSIIEQLPDTHDARLTLQHLRLLKWVLASLGMSVEIETMQQLPFQWPMSVSSHIDGSAVVGRSSLRIFAESNIVTSPEHVLWLMGDGLADLFSLDEAHQPLDRTTGLPWRLLVTTGLSQVLRVPSLKPDLWRQLAVLRRFLRAAGSL